MTTRLPGITWEHARGHVSVLPATDAYRAVAPDAKITWEDHRSREAFADQPREGQMLRPYRPVDAFSRLALAVGRG